MALSTDIKRFGMYYLVGYGTELNVGSAFNQLSYAGKDNSGLTIGVTQVDLAYNKNFRESLTNNYNAWLVSTGKDVEKLKITATQLAFKSDDAKNILNSVEGKALNEYLATDEGVAFARQVDSKNVGLKVDNLGNALAGTKFFNTLSDEQQFIVYTIAAKVSNQTGNADKMLNLLKGNPTQANEKAPWFTMLDSDSPEQIVQKLVDYTQTYSSLTARAGAFKSFTLSKSLYDLYRSDAFSDTRAFLQDPNNNIEGFGANSSTAVTAELSILRALSAQSEPNSNGTLSYNNNSGWIKDPLTENQIWVDDQVVVVLDKTKQNCSGIYSRSNNTWIYSTNGETISSNDVEMKFLANGNVLVDSNGDYYLIKDNANIEISEMGASFVNIQNSLSSGNIAEARTAYAKIIGSDVAFPYYSSQDFFNKTVNSSNLEVTTYDNGRFSTLKAEGNTFIVTEDGMIMQYNNQTSKVTVITGQYTESSYTIDSSLPMSDELLGSIAEALSSSTTTTLPNGFSGTVTISSANSADKITLTTIPNANGEIIGTETTVKEGNVETTTQSYNDASLPTLTTVKTDNFVANYSNGAFQGFSSINGASVSAGFNEQFSQALKDQGIENITQEDINRLSYELDDSAIGPKTAVASAYESTLENTISGTDDFGHPILMTHSEYVTKTVSLSIASIGDALSLIRSIQSGQPLPILATGLRLANDIDLLNGGGRSLELGAASSVASSVLSLYSLADALKKGDSIAAVTSASYAVYGAAEAVLYLQSSHLISDVSSSVGVVSETLGKALPYLSVVNSIAHGDYVGAAVSVASYWVPYVGWAYAAFSIVKSLFGHHSHKPDDPWGNGHFIWNGNDITYQSQGKTGGKEAVSNVMNNVLSVLNNLIEQERQTNPSSALGIIPNRMPTIAYDMSGYRYTDIDPLTGEEKHAYLRFDTSGNPYNATPGSTESYQSIIEAMVRSALTRSAIAPLWEVQTAKMQTDAGDPKAGLTEEARAGRDGALATAITGDTQTFRPVTLDLSGDGKIDVISKDASTVNFDVDDSGYLKKTAWIDGGDAFLTLDRDYNGETNTGKEMFSNATVALGRRGLAGMAWVDANYDGKITAADPVWNELRIWQDVNEDGVQAKSESHKLSDLGITELNYAMGTFTQNGVVKKLSSQDLVADTEGSRINVVPEGIIVETSKGELSLLVTRIDDQTAVQANQDGISGYEDVEMIIAAADLLANDKVGGFSGRELTLKSLGDFKHGTGFIDANGFVHFIPEPNYAGSDAGFSYTTTAQNGQSGTGDVKITLQNVNDAPTLDHVDHDTVPVYGYTPIEYDYDSGRYVSGGDPIYSGTTPIAYEDTGRGKVIGADIDDPVSSLTYELVNGPQYGSVSLDGQGNYTYISWKESGVPSDRIIIDGQYAGLKDGTLYTQNNLPREAIYPTSDVFQVKIIDPHGSTTIQSITIPHYGPYLPVTPPGGNVGGHGKKPIAVDLNGDGFHFVNVNDSNVFFDVTGDGWKRKTAWVGADDGILAFDSDNNGKIEKASEISFVGYKDGAQTDLEGLKAFDTNGDGKFSAQDEKWNQFGIWQDANQNGITDEGEFKKLSDLGIESIGLTSDGKFTVVNKQTVHGVGSMTKSDGTSLAIADVTLEYSAETKIPGTNTSVTPTSPFSASGEEINGTEDKDLILGKNGNNIVNAYGGDDVIFEDGGNDIIYAGDGNDVVYSGEDNDLVFGEAGNDIIYAGKGDDIVLAGNGNDVVFADLGNDIVFGGDGNDFISGGAGNDVLSGDAGNDELYGESGNDALFGGDGDDKLSGLDGYDRLDGGAGNDILDGGADADEMIGGAGDDTYVVDNAADVVTELANEGNDTVNASIDYTLGTNLENLTLLGDKNLHGIGNELDNNLLGNSGNNILEGKEGNDTLNGGLGADRMIGGLGDDLYYVDNSGDAVIEAAGEGNDTIYASVNYQIANNVEKLVLTGYEAINATGNDADNILIGNAASNILDGGLGADSMSGGKGNDTYSVDNAADTVTELANEGIDTIKASVSLTLGDNTENLFLTGNEAINATGNALNNILVGNGAANILNGGLGADAMAGGAGDDTYYVDNVNDRVVEKTNEGQDSVYSSVTYTTADNVENLTLLGEESINAYGNELSNMLVGNNASNILDGKEGSDTLIGKDGDDTYYVDNTEDHIIENLNEGTDNVIASASYTLSDNVENLTLVGSENLQGEGNSLDNTLVGNLGNNTLDGKAGSDTMLGGLGDDLYYVDNVNDTVVENAQEGYDTIRTSVTYTASANVERLELIGDDAINAYGNELDNVLLGNSNNNILEGGLGVDTMSGGAGDDTYYVDNVDDTIVEMLNEGNDSVISNVSYTLSSNVENLTLIGDEALNATGNDLDNIIQGNALDNTIDGKEGVDTMLGAQGNDSYYVDNEQDLVIENLNEGIDTIYSTVSYVLPENVENLIMIGNGAINAGGNSANNTLIGNDADNYIFGGAGDDYIDGKGGNDTLEGGTGNDTFIYNLGDGLDTIIEKEGNDTVKFTDGLSLDNVALRIVNVNGTLTAQVRILNEGGCEQADQGFDFTLTQDRCGHLISPIEHFTFADGSSKTWDDLLIKTKITYATPWQTTIQTGRNDDIIYGSCRSNVIYAGTGNDIVYAYSGGDTVYGEGGNDYLYGDVGNDTLDGGCGNDILSGSYGRDYLKDGYGNNILMGGAQDDIVEAGIGNDFIAGGSGNDILNAGAGYNVFAFERGDGRDTILPASGAHNTLSLSGMNYNDIQLSQKGDDLILNMGCNSQVTLKNWYTSAENQNIDTLQMVSSTYEYNFGFLHVGVTEKPDVETFDFPALVESFDEAKSANPRLNSWNAMNGLLDAHLSSSDSMALGGDLAWNYSKTGDLSNVSLASAQTILQNPTFGATAQAINTKDLCHY